VHLKTPTFLVTFNAVTAFVARGNSTDIFAHNFRSWSRRVVERVAHCECWLCMWAENRAATSFVSLPAVQIDNGHFAGPIPQFRYTIHYPVYAIRYAMLFQILAPTSSSCCSYNSNSDWNSQRALQNMLHATWAGKKHEQ